MHLKSLQQLFGFGAMALVGGQAAAHTFTLSLGDDAGATDHYGVICSTDGGYDTDHLYLRVQNTTPNSPLLSAQVRKGSLATNTTDPVSGDGEASPASKIQGGNGVYDVTVDKTGAGSVVYIITVHCMDASGTIHTGTDGIVYQDQ